MKPAWFTGKAAAVLVAAPPIFGWVTFVSALKPATSRWEALWSLYLIVSTALLIAMAVRSIWRDRA